MSFEEGGVISLPVNAFALEERLRDVTPPRSPTLLDRIADGKAEQWEVMGITREEWEEDKRYVAESLRQLAEMEAAGPLTIQPLSNAQRSEMKAGHGLVRRPVSADSDEGSEGGCRSTPRDRDRIRESNDDGYSGDASLDDIPEHLLWEPETDEEEASKRTGIRGRWQRRREDHLDLGRNHTRTRLSCPACGTQLEFRTEVSLHKAKPSLGQLQMQHDALPSLEDPDRGDRETERFSQYVRHSTPSWLGQPSHRALRSEEKYRRSSTSPSLGTRHIETGFLPARPAASPSIGSIERSMRAQTAKGESGARGSSETSVRGRAWLYRAGQALAGFRTLPSAAGVVFVIGVAASFYLGKKFA